MGEYVRALSNLDHDDVAEDSVLDVLEHVAAAEARLERA